MTNCLRFVTNILFTYSWGSLGRKCSTKSDVFDACRRRGVHSALRCSQFRRSSLAGPFAVFAPFSLPTRSFVGVFYLAWRARTQVWLWLSPADHFPCLTRTICCTFRFSRSLALSTVKWLYIKNFSTSCRPRHVHTLLLRRPRNTTAMELRRFPLLFESLFPPNRAKPKELRRDVFVGFCVTASFV